MRLDHEIKKRTERKKQFCIVSTNVSTTLGVSVVNPC